MHNITELQKIISDEINKVKFNSEPINLYEPIKYTLDAGGKRIRPALVLAACNIFSDDIDSAIPIALAYEIFHNFTLLHDDIVDNSPIRRNKDTVHVKWDTNTAILSGDAMMIKAYSFLKTLPANLLKNIFSLFNNTALEVCEGQQFDMDFENKDIVSKSQYLNMIRLKTSVLIASSLKAGALCGNASKKDADLLYNFGLNIGLAFQLQDDLLDVYADSSIFGKKTGNDIITAKKTFLLINAFEKADSKTSNKLKNIISDKNINEQEKIKEVTNIYNKLKIRELTENKISEFHKLAISSLNSISVKEGKKEILLSFANMIMKRNK